MCERSSGEESARSYTPQGLSRPEAVAYAQPVRGAAIVAAILLAAIVVFQLALALGAPLGDAAWGGQHAGVLPPRLRIASGVAASAIYPLFILVVLASARVIEADWLPVKGRVAMWTLAGLLTLGALANFASRSKRERYWGPVAFVIGICCAVVASEVD
jgi:hypothetical protein